jgi:hypothetical protein
VKPLVRLALAALLVLPLAAAAQWEGSIDMKISGKEVAGSASAFVGKTGSRMQIEMRPAAGPQAGTPGMKMTVLARTAEPGVSYLINDAQKSYARIDAKEIEKQVPPAERDRKWSVKRLGTDKVAGYACERALVTQEGSDTENDVCVTKDLGGSAGLFNTGRRGSGTEIEKTLKANNLEGMPVRMLLRKKGDKEVAMSWELVKAEKRPVPASTFEIPAGYRETSMMGTMMTPEQQKQIDDAMKNMTPEQRKMMEQMMKKQGSGGGH